MSDLQSLAGNREQQEYHSIEIRLLLSAINLRYGYDFTDYQEDAISHRIQRFLQENRFDNVSQVIGPILRDQTILYRLLPYLSISVTAMFRDPSFYRTLVHEVFPILRTWPRIKIWHAGCATGEEVYSLAILLKEANLLDRSMIYATDISESALATARQGIFSLPVLKAGSANYLKAGGASSFANYYTADADSGIIAADIRKRVTFARHNLAMDASFGDMHLILCRNVLIYFNETLKNRVLESFHYSLEHGGFLGLGQTESLCFSSVEDGFSSVDDSARVYKCLGQREYGHYHNQGEGNDRQDIDRRR